ncbi:helix-turn-helix domain-containing protein [Brachybacterium sp. NBEC-018]|uniref:helix-turn-helix transcriptional regulator n=1 Tax=Brachybacterium sp. NBEC-018 TaxID=2996004 RepID=UPI002174FD26|nr:helix-turn-helix domain-containing protein [Brachybacterium sp. NBEC-018]UVY85397.1 helix-turn-helix domain-containing protein [Brachybacterium sp. NBEC-018]
MLLLLMLRICVLRRKGMVRGMDEYLTTMEVAKWLRVDRSTLCRWRLAGTGPRVIWLGPSSPRYARADVLAWLQEMAA